MVALLGYFYSVEANLWKMTNALSIDSAKITNSFRKNHETLTPPYYWRYIVRPLIYQQL